MSESTVLVTGATGFIAQHVVDKLLKRKYRVIGTARSEARYSPILEEFKKKYPEGNLTFEVVADIAADDAFDEVLKNHPEIKYVLHTASPFSYGLNKPFDEAYLNPALHGTLNILNAIKKYAPQVTNVVITSSFAAVKQLGDAFKTEIHTNESWNPIKWEEVKNENEAYSASKTYAERAARKFYEEEKPAYNLATVNPPMVLGPQLFDSSVEKVLNTSNEFLNKITHLDPTSTAPQDKFALLAVDVRDVAEFHVLPLENKELESEREFIVSSPLIAQAVLNILNDNFPELHGKIARGDYSSVDDVIARSCPKYDVSSTLKKASDYKLISLEKSVVDVYKQYLSKYSFS
ncbi:hypothetical protein PICMEDRAFT_9519 [Pichia membranifaciens NRRL Y-2026]|uniref:NAD-dependent epimerase/dehydratase domain-containing protein n=1 Tax=Pichia membranifaciens NRRL Y-2026 TaxID=763406 RepID=A0A1E3NSH4_9ASCO|nr:hypothetical protein PICMEDRAFT_9519 [Pichia membranifaciens NRRL Y-2026]ODQ49022.1 hypothetical protein PICMEDRAFT_9519 [Pichia membranifaciens NRRL Y-2026]